MQIGMNTHRLYSAGTACRVYQVSLYAIICVDIMKVIIAQIIEKTNTQAHVMNNL